MLMEEWKLGDSNKSGIYILPMLGQNENQFYSKYVMPQCQFRNCFVADNNKALKDKIILVYEFSSTNLYMNFVFTLKKLDFFEDSYELDKNHTVFIFTIPIQFKNDYDRIIEGNYSKISRLYKDHIMKFHEYSEHNEVFGILYRTGARRDQLEEKINQGLPKFQWTKIPPFTELEEPFDETEILQSEIIINKQA